MHPSAFENPLAVGAPEAPYGYRNPTAAGAPAPAYWHPNRTPTGAVQGSPYPFPPQQAALQQWSVGLCDCMNDCGVCCLTAWCPCITFGRIAEIADKGSISCCASGTLCLVIALLSGCQFLYSCSYRTKVRAMYNLPESPCVDCCVHCCCDACALCQEYKELQNHGFDMTIGYRLNVERAARAIQLPPMHPFMMR